MRSATSNLTCNSGFIEPSSVACSKSSSSETTSESTNGPPVSFFRKTLIEDVRFCSGKQEQKN